jgi:hypothetical protein
MTLGTGAVGYVPPLISRHRCLCTSILAPFWEAEADSWYLLYRLNLTVATRIHILEPQWNPSVEKQAIGRVLRLGQDKQVTIIRYIMNGTVEKVTRRENLITNWITNSAVVHRVSTTEKGPARDGRLGAARRWRWGAAEAEATLSSYPTDFGFSVEACLAYTLDRNFDRLCWGTDLYAALFREIYRGVGNIQFRAGGENF